MTRPVRLAMLVAAPLAVAMAVAAVWVASPLPAGLTSRWPDASLTIEDRHGLPLRTTRAPDGRDVRWMPLAEIDPDVLRAFVALEDRRFYEHGGVDLRAVARAARDNLHAGRIVSGASTITMQTARLLVPMPRGWVGKAREALWALRLERHLSKQQILEQYLNRLPLGQGATGVAAAAALYFDAAASDLSLAQAALLAGLAHAPSADNPFVSRTRAVERRRLVLKRLQREAYVTETDLARATAEPLAAVGRGRPFLAPHFTTRVLLRADSAPAPPGGVWRTSLDLALQTALEAEVHHAVRTLASRGVQHGALVALDNVTGEILAWVGSPDFWADTAGQVDMVVSRRQPGSALKPFLYALALERGYTPASVLPDVASTYDTPTGPYRPRNYDRVFHGPVRVREALASSFNVPAVELANRLGPSPFLRTLRAAGFASLDRGADHYGIGLALGNGDVTLLEVANAYRVLANLGVWRPVSWEPAASAAPGAAPERRVVSAPAAALILDILSDPAARVPGFGLVTPFDFPFPAAVKTGTSRNFTDNWAVAVTQRFTIAVWVGNFSGRPMEGVSGVSGAGPLLQRAVLMTARRHAPGVFATPDELGAVPIEICPLSGMRPGAYCPRGVEWLAPGTAPTDTCSWHRHDGTVVLPPRYAEWAAHHAADPAWDGTREAVRAALGDPGRRFRITAPQDGDRYAVPPGVDPHYATIGLRAAGGAARAVRWFVDGRPLAKPRWQLRAGAHVIRAETGFGEADEVRVVVDQ